MEYVLDFKYKLGTIDFEVAIAFHSPIIYVIRFLQLKVQDLLKERRVDEDASEDDTTDDSDSDEEELDEEEVTQFKLFPHSPLMKK